MAVKQWKLDTWLKRSILERDVEDARKSLAAGADPNHSMVEGEIRSLPLIQAATKHADLVEVLLEYGADVSARDWLGATALHFANDPDIIIKLLAAGADPKAKSNDGSTALHASTSVKKVQLLIDAGADPMALNAKGELPWQAIEALLGRMDTSAVSLSPPVQSCQAAINMLRSLAQNESLHDATTRVQMTAEDETKKVQDGRF